MTDQEYNKVFSRLTDIFQSNERLLHASQKKASIPVVVRIAKKIKSGLFKPGIYVQDKTICEGHHRYLASLLVGYPPEIMPWKLSSAYETYEWSSFELSAIDFDSDIQAEEYTAQTALYNDIEMQLVRNILKNVLDL